MVQRNPLLVVAIGDFNAKSSNWFCHGKINFEEDEIESLTSQFGLHKVIKEPTHILDTSSSCIDLGQICRICPDFIRLYIQIVIIR